MDNISIFNRVITCFIKTMSNESLNRTSNVDKTPRVNVDVLKQRIIEQKKKDKVKKTVLFSTVCVSLGVLTILSS